MPRYAGGGKATVESCQSIDVLEWHQRGYLRSPFRGAAVRALMATRTKWTGTASVLLGALGEMAGERIAKAKTWGDGPRALAGRLRRAATFLRKIGIEISFDREGRARTRTIHIAAAPSHPVAESAGAQPSAPSTASASMSKSNSANGFATPPLRTVARCGRLGGSYTPDAGQLGISGDGKKLSWH
jgi:hypothetical protein